MYRSSPILAGIRAVKHHRPAFPCKHSGGEERSVATIQLRRLITVAGAARVSLKDGLAFPV